MKIIITTVLLLSFTFSNAQKDQLVKIKLKKGTWISELQLNKEDVLPFELHITKNGSDYVFIIQNAEERITLNKPEIINDSMHVRFPNFNSELIFAINNCTFLNGYWVNYNKGKNYKIPFTSKKIKSNEYNRFAFISNKSHCNTDFTSKWAVTFEPNTNTSYPAVGLIKQIENKLTGTFLTETGDYRYLSGNCSEDSIYLSCFDGSHAFLFKAAYTNDTLKGKFFSGSHWQSDWIGIKNERAQLRNPDELTYITSKNDQVKFTLKKVDGTEFSYPNKNYENKVVIIQIMGSWCPNCLDETHYYKQLYDKYHDSGLEIISIAYETGASFDDYVNNVMRLQKKLNLDFTFLIGGAANKGMASEHFHMLNEVISFPTSIYIGRDGTVKRVHTGFNGPGTGTYYKEYVEKTNALIESLLAD